KLWEIIFKICRIDEEDPISAWQTHKNNLHKRCNYLNQKQFKALKLTSPETNLTIGLPKDHIWNGGSVVSKNGIEFIPNLPTEEIFTLPHKGQVDGVVKTTRPILIQGNLVEDITFRFSEGKIVKVSAIIGDEVIKKTIELDEGARRLGEIALVPCSSPISKTGLLFYNIIIDENASSHIAIGGGFRSSLKNGDSLNDEEFQTAGGNESIIHIDFMIGSKDMNVDGIEENGTAEPVMRNGEWAFRI
ncbi:MAG: aminopeptidase, partial [Promethearchaeota archaeon]